MAKKLFLIFTVFAILLSAQVAGATAITADGLWHTFLFEGAESAWDLTFEFTLTETATLTVTDTYVSGDQFDVFNFDAYLGPTSTPTAQGAFTTDFDYAAANPEWSTGVWILGPGSYSIWGIAVQSPYESGAGGLKLESGGDVVPIPGAVWLLGSGLLGLAGFRKKLFT